MRKFSLILCSVPIVWLTATPANAHVSVTGGIGFANQTQEITFGVGHGCAGVDTLSVRIEISAGVTSVRAIGSQLGAPKVQTDAAGLVTSVTWRKPMNELAVGDPNYYKVSIRAKLPDAPFSVIYFPTTQTCSTPEGVMSSVDWIATPTMPDAGAGEPAPSLVVLPPRTLGWNKFTLKQSVADLKGAFGDAQIVWRGVSAYSPSATTTELISNTSRVTPLTALAFGDTIWVRY